jgi:TonB-dependent starch-binding outer membrane protein SusC
MEIKKLLIFCISSLLFTLYGNAQDITVKGKVVDEKGMSVPGATILVQGTKTATSTGFDGEYTIKAQSNSVLLASFIGYKSKTANVNGQSVVNFNLAPETSALSEVVVIGYSTQKRTLVTGAISRVSAKDLEKVPVGRVEQALQGRVSGVIVANNSGQPGSEATIRVRGVTSFGGSINNPLWVIDGVPNDGGGALGFLNQSDIESIEVLKDAASAAIYGTRASAGVILVTTKKGKAGKIAVSYNVFTGVSGPAKLLKLLNATQYGALINEKAVADGKNIVYPNLSELGTGTDWQKAIFNNSAMRYSHELSISGGNDVSNFYFSVGIQDQQGIVLSDISNYNRKNFRLNSNHKISNTFSFGQTLGFARQKSVGIGDVNGEKGGALSSAIHLDPITKLIETDPVLASQYNSLPNAVRDENGNFYGISNAVGQEMVNPLAYAKTRLGGFGFSDDFVGNIYLEANISKHIKVKSTLGGKIANYGYEQFTPLFYLSPTNTGPVKNNYSRGENKVFNWNIDNTIAYSNKLGNHNFKLLLGQATYVDGLGGGVNATIKGLPVTNYRDASFNFNTAQIDRESGIFDFTPHRTTSLFSQLTYDYKEKYLLTANIRRDGSTRFGKNNKFGNFPGISLGWVVTKEDFFKENNTLNFLKLRGSYGTVGKDGIPDFRYTSTVSGGYNYTFGNAGVITTGYANDTLENPFLKWEETTQIDLGFDAKLFNDLTITAAVFKKTTNGILRDVPTPGYVGVDIDPAGNVASLENRGLDLELGYKKKLGNVNCSINAFASYLENEIISLDKNANFIVGDAGFQGIEGGVTRSQVGHSINSFYGWKTAGIFQNVAEVNAYVNTAGLVIQPNAVPGDFKWVDTDGNGKIDLEDRQFLGSNIPKFTFGFTLNLDYKGFDLMANAQGTAGSKIFQGLRRFGLPDANYQTKALGRWNGEGTSNSYPRLSSNDPNKNFANMSDFYLEDGDYLRLKLVQLGYTIPSTMLRKLVVSKLRVYVTAENLFTLTKYTGYDPEIGGDVLGIDKGQYPQARTFMLGANIQF